ncbi:MAG: hypothetical protein NTY22_00910 [Proteobacteria bacterium]|nr:hypothetical protein [Pseudomonadota bacterium]
MLKFLFKLIVLIIVILILLQLEYKGRKLQTYVMEYFKSLKGHKEIMYIQEEPTEKKTVPVKQTVTEKKIIVPEKKTVKHIPKKATEPKKIKMIKQKADDQPEVTEEDRQELQQILK